MYLALTYMKSKFSNPKRNPISVLNFQIMETSNQETG
jgi:hypothetical protein